MTTIHPATVSRLLRRATSALVTASFLVAQAAQACPGCKQALGGDGAGGNHSVNGAGMGYAITIGMLLLTLAAIMFVVGRVAYRNCMALAAQHEAAMAARLAAGNRA